MTELFNIQSLIGEATAYDKKEMLERKNPRSWLKSVSAFANGEGGALIFGIADNDEVVGLADAKRDSEDISEAVKSHMDPIPTVELTLLKIDGKQLIVLRVLPGQETPYYYVANGQRQTFVRIGNESVMADRIQLKQLVLRGAGRTFDSLPSRFKFTDMAFTKLRSIHFNRLHRSFEDSEFESWGILDEEGRLTNAGALVADDAPIRHSRVFCTRWNGRTMTSGLGEATDDAEIGGSIINQLQEAVAFVRNNSHRRWWKESDHREELPDYPERAVSEALVNAIIHRDYMQLGSEVHVDIYDDRIEIYSPGGMFDGSLVQNQDPLAIPSKRRNPLLADFFSRLGLMERRGSGMRKMIEAYQAYEHLVKCRAPEFRSTADEFHVVLWNMNWDEEHSEDVLKEFVKEGKHVLKDEKDVLKENEDVLKDGNCSKKEIKKFLKARKEFLKARRTIYQMISKDSRTTIPQMAEAMGVSERHVRRYLKRLTELKLIAREGGRKLGEWKITDEEYTGFFDRI